MAIDTVNKRRSAHNLPWCVIGPVPDVDISTADRQLIAGFYNGIPATSLIVLPTEHLNIESSSVVRGFKSFTNIFN